MKNTAKSAGERAARQAAHLKPHWFRPGQSGNPKGRKPGSVCTRTLFMQALKRFEETHRIDLFEHFVRTAYRNPTVLIAAMNKLLPNKSEVSFGPDELERTKAKFVEVLARHVSDPAVIEQIAGDLAAVEVER